MKLQKLFTLLGVFCLTGCNTNTFEKTTTVWEMTSEAKAYYDYYQANPDKYYLEYGDTFKEMLDGLLDREKVPQEMVSGLTLTNEFTKSTCEGETVYTVEKENYENIVLYLHGGAYIYEALSVHYSYCDGLVDALNAKVVLPLYPLAPQYTYEKAYTMIETLYKDLLTENKPIYIMGDSAGGGFTLAFTEYCIANNIKAPNKIIMFSPWVDLTMSNPDIENYESVDTTLAPFGTKIAARFWAGDTELTDYRVSPLYGDLSNLPDMMVFVSNEEILYPDIMKLYNGVKNANVKLVVGNGYFHVFPIYPLPERQQSYSLISEFIK